MKSIKFMFSIMLTGIVSLTSCTADMEQTTADLNYNKNETAKPVLVECNDIELCAEEAVLYYVNNGETNKENFRCLVVSKTWTNGVMYGSGRCSDGSFFSFHYVDGVAYITFAPR